MPIENETANRNYPLPAGANDLVDDVERIIDAFEGVDTDVANLLASLADKAGLTSPVFDGVPQAPTAVPGTSSAQLATTAFVAEEIAGLNIDAELARRISIDAQSFTDQEKGRARTNIGADVLAGFRNKIINGNFDIWQRGTGPYSTSGDFCADRWRMGSSATGLSASRTTFVNNGHGMPFFPSFHISLTISAAGNGNCIRQNIENVRTLAGKRATVTLWVYRDATFSANRPLQNIYLTQFFGTGGSPASEVVTSLAVADEIPSEVWTKITKTVDIPTIAGKQVGTDGNDFLQLRIDANAAATGGIRFARVSLVEGDARAEADPFSPRHIQQEWALCQRYYDTVRAYMGGYGATGSVVLIHFPFNTRKRAAPSCTVSGPSYTNASGLTVTEPLTTGATVSATVTTAGGFSALANIRADAEL